MGCVVRPVKPVGVFGARYFEGEESVARRREVERMATESEVDRVQKYLKCL